MEREMVHISIFLWYLDLYLSTTSFQCRKCRCFAKKFDTFAHAWSLVRIPNRYWVQHVVVDPEAKSFVFLLDKHNRWGPLVLDKLDRVHHKQLTYVLLSEFSGFRAFAIGSWLCWSVICLLGLFFALPRLNRIKISVTHAGNCVSMFINL